MLGITFLTFYADPLATLGLSKLTIFKVALPIHSSHLYFQPFRNWRPVGSTSRQVPKMLQSHYPQLWSSFVVALVLCVTGNALCLTHLVVLWTFFLRTIVSSITAKSHMKSHVLPISLSKILHISHNLVSRSTKMLGFLAMLHMFVNLLGHPRLLLNSIN